ncbi:MAG: hypothetical protein ACI9CQ_003378 [Saprospiraceae bacterium]|jgi:hypothetical protein
MNKYLLFLFLLFFFGCAEDAPRQGYLRSDELISRHFNNFQIDDLETIMAFFEKKTCQTVPTTPGTAIDCYKAFSKSLSVEGSFGELDLGLPLEEQKEMMTTLRPVTYNAIWVDRNQIQTDTTAKFGLKYGGQYANFLKAFGKENEAIKQYIDVFDQVGNITPSMIASVLLEYEKFGLENQRGRMVLAIHYVTLNKMMDN